jgi:hypothetical protein
MRTIGTDGGSVIDPERIIFVGIIDGEMWSIEVDEDCIGSFIDHQQRQLTVHPLVTMSTALDAIRDVNQFHEANQ